MCPVMVQKDGRQVEELIAKPRILSGVGCPGLRFTRALPPANPDYQNKDNVSVDVSWPYPDESGVAFCAVDRKARGRGGVRSRSCSCRLRARAGFRWFCRQALWIPNRCAL